MECFNRLTNSRFPGREETEVFISISLEHSPSWEAAKSSATLENLWFIGSKGLLQHSKEAATYTYPEQVRTIPCPHIPLFKDKFLYYTSIEAMAFQVVSFPQVYHWLHLCTSLTPHVLQVPPISLKLLWTLVLYFVRSGHSTVWTTSMRLQFHLLLTTLKYHLCEINVYYIYRCSAIYNIL